MNPLPSLRKDLRRHNLDGDLLIYDPENDQVHLLNASTARVLELMDKGFDADGIAATLASTHPAGNGEELLSIALDELAIAQLLEKSSERTIVPLHENATRREMVRKLIAASAAVAIPTILTLTPGPASAQSFGRPNGAACTVNSQCASGCCAKNSSGTCTTSQCSAAGCGNASACNPP